LGIAVEQVQRCGVRILEVKGNSPAEKAGLQAGDVIVAVNTKPISGVEEIRGFIVTSQVGEEILLTYQRATGQFDARVKLTDIPKSTVATLPATEPATPAK
jgi:S1-C subfamily serine protease